MDKLLTIVIPVYNTEKYLSKCIQSVLIPEYMDQLDVIIVIDGSPDNSLAIASEYEKKYPNSIKVIDKPNGGHGSAINKGVELAVGRYFKVLDSDDWFDTEEFRTFLSLLKNCDQDLVLCNYSKEYVYEKRSEQMICDVEYNRVIKADEFEYINCVGDKLLCLAKITYKTELLKEMHFSLPEHMFYVDVIYQLLPFYHVESFIAYDLSLYRYFIGRPGQSVSKDIMIRNISHHENVVKICVEYYLKQLPNLRKNKLFFLRMELAEKIMRHYHQLFALPFKTMFSNMRKWDEYIHESHVMEEVDYSNFKFLMIRERSSLAFLITVYYIYKCVLYFKVVR